MAGLRFDAPEYERLMADPDMRFRAPWNVPWKENTDLLVPRRHTFLGQTEETAGRYLSRTQQIITTIGVLGLSAPGCTNPVELPPNNGGKGLYNPTANLGFDAVSANSGMLNCVGRDEDGDLVSLEITGPSGMIETVTFPKTVERTLETFVSGLQPGTFTYTCNSGDADGGQKGISTKTVVVDPPPEQHDPTAELAYTPKNETSGDLVCTGKDSDGNLTRLRITGPSGVDETKTFAETTESSLEVALGGLQPGTHEYQCTASDADGGPQGVDTETVTVADQQTVLEGDLVESLGDQGRSGKILLYSPGDITTAVDSLVANAQGEFSGVLVNPLANYLAKAVLLDSDGKQTSATSTIPSLDVVVGQTNDLGVIQVFPTDWMAAAGTNLDEWREHADTVNFNHNTALGFGYTESLGFRPEDFDILYVFLDNPELRNGQSKGSWSVEDQQEAANNVRSQLALYFGNNHAFLNNVALESDTTQVRPYSIQNGFVIPNQGAYLVMPDTVLASSGGAGIADFNRDGWVDGVKLRFNKPRALIPSPNNYLWAIAHEVNHSVSGAGHTLVYSRDESVNVSGDAIVRSLLNPSEKDVKFALMMTAHGGRQPLLYVLGGPIR